MSIRWVQATPHRELLSSAMVALSTQAPHPVPCPLEIYSATKKQKQAHPARTTIQQANLIRIDPPTNLPVPLLLCHLQHLPRQRCQPRFPCLRLRQRLWLWPLRQGLRWRWRLQHCRRLRVCQGCLGPLTHRQTYQACQTGPPGRPCPCRPCRPYPCSRLHRQQF